MGGIITSWNKSAERLFGYVAKEAIGQPITILIPPDRLEEELEIISRLKRGERVDHFDTVRRRKDGSLIDISLTISPVRDASGNIIGASKVARDTTKARELWLSCSGLTQPCNSRTQPATTSRSHCGP
jgi:PAS domain S-box-containing protein